MSEQEATTALTDDERDEIAGASSPSIGRIVLGSAVAAVIAGGAAGLGIATAVPAPVPEDYAIAADGQLAPAAQLATTPHNPDGVLSAEDEERVLRDAERVNAPAVITQLHYLVLAENDENVNDTVEEFIRDNRPELIVGVGLGPRQSFVFAGATAAAGVGELSTTLYDEAAGNRVAGIIGGTAGAGAVGAIAVGTIGGYSRHRSRRITQARAEMDLVTREYGQLTGRLDQIDLRAHSLSSPVADATMRRQWQRVRDRFLRIHDDVDALGGLTISSPDNDFLAKSEEITAALTTRQVNYAEDNIDTLFRLEHGDDTVRRAELQALRSDVVDAQVSLTDAGSGLYRELERLRGRGSTTFPPAPGTSASSTNSWYCWPTTAPPWPSCAARNTPTSMSGRPPSWPPRPSTSGAGGPATATTTSCPSG